MTDPNTTLPSDPRSGRIAFIAGLVMAALFLFASFAPERWRLWGFDSLAYGDTVARFVWLLGAGLFAAGVALAVERSGLIRRRSGFFILLWMGLIIALSLTLPDVTHLRGDGVLLWQNFHQSTLMRLRAPLTALLIETLRDLFHARSSILFYRDFELFWLILYLAAVWQLLRRFPEPMTRWVALVVLTLNGSLLLMSNMIEYYAPVFSVAMLALAVSLSAMDRGRYPFAGLALALVASALHYLAAVLLPAFVLPLLPRLGKMRTLLLFALLAAGGVVAGMRLFPENLLWPLGPHQRDALTLYDPRHLLDLLNLFVWAMPAGLVLLPLLFGKGTGAGPLSDAREGFLAAGTLGALGFTLAFAPDLGMARDADLLSLVALPGSLWLLHRVARTPERFNPTLLAVVIFSGVLGIAGQLALHHSEPKSVQRFVRMLHRDPERSYYGWEALGIHYRTQGNLEKEYDSLRMAVRFSNNWRYFARLADIAKDRRQFNVAEAYIQRALEERPNEPGSLYTLAHIQILSGHREEGKATLARCLEESPNIVSAYSLMGLLLYEDGDYTGAEEVMLKGARYAGSLDPLYYATFTLIENRLGKHAAARKLFEQIKTRATRNEIFQMAQEAYENSLQALRGK